MIYIFLTFIHVYCQLQLNPINGQNFFYKFQDVLNTTGYTLQVLQPNLGFEIQGGFVAGGLNSMIQTQNVISTSLYQKMNLIGLLEQGSNYSVSTTAYNLSGYLNDQTYLFNVSSVNQTCQNFEIIGYVNVILHCINISTSQITIYLYNNSQLIQVNTGYTLNNLSQLQSTTIQYFYEDGIYDIYFIYISQFQSFVLNCQLNNNSFSQLQQIWSQPAQYIQIFVSFEQEVFALQFNYLLYQYGNYKEKFQSQNGSNWLSMNILYDEYDEFLIYLVNNYTIYEIYFEYTFQIFSQQLLPVSISSAQIYSDVNYIFILTSKQTLVYQYEGDTFQFYQYSQYSIMNKLNQYSSLSNIIINTNSSGIQLFQLLDYFLYNDQPSQSGFITIGMFNQNNQMIQNQTIYINVLQSYQNQICPILQTFNGISYYSNNSYYQQVEISQFYIGSNLTYAINQTTLNGISILNQQNNRELNQSMVSIGVYSISQQNSILKVQIQDFNVVFEIIQYSFESQDFQSLLDVKLQLDITDQDIYFITYDNGTVMTLIATEKNLIYAFQIDPIVGFISNYTINLTDTLNSSSLQIVQGVTINSLLFVLTTDQQLISIQIFTTYYIIEDFIGTDYYYIAGYQYEQYFLFAVKIVSNIFYVDIFTWDNNQFQLFQTLQLGFVEDTSNHFGVSINPVEDGIFICYDISQIRFYEKSSFVETNIGQQQFYYQINTTNITFIQNTQSDIFLYSLVKYNNDYYVNVYQGTQILNSLYQSIYVDVTPGNVGIIYLSVPSDIINQYDYLAFVVNDEAYIYQIPYKYTIQQFPNSYYSTQFSINNSIIVSNPYNSQFFYLNFTIFQNNIQISQIQNLTQISINLTNGIIVINPYQYFSGVIQSYSVSCTQCQNLSINNIITNNYFYYNYSTIQSTSYIQDDIQYIYNLDVAYLFLYAFNMSNQLNSRDVTQNATLIQDFPTLNSNALLLFLEFETNSITWLINLKSILYICSVINGTKQNITVSGFNSSNTAKFAVYNKGILQIIAEHNYSCYYYYVNNQTMQLEPILSNVFVNALSEQNAYGFISVYMSENNYLFGMYYLDIYSTLQFILLDLSTNSQGYKLNGYLQFPLEEIVSFQKDFQFQYIQQYGSPLQENHTSFIYLAYTTAIDSGILELEFLGINLVLFQQVCSIFMINSTFYNNYLNLLSLYDNQIAIMNYPQDHQNSSLTLSLYLIDFNQCQSVQPYSFQILGPFNYEDLELNGFSLNYLNSNELLLSLNGYTFVIEVNQLLQITYQTFINSTIILTAQNPFYQQNQSIQITFTPYIIPNNSNNTDNNNTNNNSNNSNNTNNNTSSHQLKWYWILLITIGSLVIIGGIFILLYYKLKNEDQSNYSKFSGKNEIEIKDQKAKLTSL